MKWRACAIWYQRYFRNALIFGDVKQSRCKLVCFFSQKRSSLFFSRPYVSFFYIALGRLCLVQTCRSLQWLLQRARSLRIIGNFSIFTATVTGCSRFAASLNEPLDFKFRQTGFSRVRLLKVDVPIEMAGNSKTLDVRHQVQFNISACDCKKTTRNC